MKPRKLGDILADFLNEVGVAKRLKQQQVILMWDRLVGQRVARRTRAVDLRDGKLFVEVEGAAWRNELLFLKGNIIQKLNNGVGARVVDDIIFITRR